MSAKLSYEEIRRLARIWSAEAREETGQDEADVPALTKEQRKRNSFAVGSRDAIDGSGATGISREKSS
jgi:hypothetical protein